MSFTKEQREKGIATRRANAEKRLAARRQAAARPTIRVNDDVFETPGYEYGEVEARDDAPSVPSTSADPFDLFLVSLDRETRDLLSDVELRQIYAEQLVAAKAEKKAQKKKAATELAKNAARMGAGLVPAATAEALAVARRNNELMRLQITLPPAGEHGEVADIGLRIDQKVFLDGHTYTLTRAQFDSFREILYRSSEHELLFQGQNKRRRQWLLSRAAGTVDTHIPLNPDGSLA